MSERPTYWAHRDRDGNVNYGHLSAIRSNEELFTDPPGTPEYGHIVPVQVADLSKVERVVSADETESIVYALGILCGHRGLLSREAAILARLTEGRGE